MPRTVIWETFKQMSLSLKRFPHTNTPQKTRNKVSTFAGQLPASEFKKAPLKLAYMAQFTY